MENADGSLEKKLVIRVGLIVFLKFSKFLYVELETEYDVDGKLFT